MIKGTYTTQVDPERAERIEELVEGIKDTLIESGADANDMVSAVFTLAARLVIVVREMGADMNVVKAALHAMLAECEGIAVPPGWTH